MIYCTGKLCSIPEDRKRIPSALYVSVFAPALPLPFNPRAAFALPFAPLNAFARPTLLQGANFFFFFFFCIPFSAIRFEPAISPCPRCPRSFRTFVNFALLVHSLQFNAAWQQRLEI